MSWKQPVRALENGFERIALKEFMPSGVNGLFTVEGRAETAPFHVFVGVAWTSGPNPLAWQIAATGLEGFHYPFVPGWAAVPCPRLEGATEILRTVAAMRECAAAKAMGRNPALAVAFEGLAAQRMPTLGQFVRDRGMKHGLQVLASAGMEPTEPTTMASLSRLAIAYPEWAAKSWPNPGQALRVRDYRTGEIVERNRAGHCLDLLCRIENGLLPEEADLKGLGSTYEMLPETVAKLKVWLP